MSTPLPDDRGDERDDAPRPDEKRLLGGGRFGLFSEALMVGLGVSVLSLPVVTAVPALAAGVSHVRRHLDGRPDTLAALWDDFRAACRGVWPVAVGAPLLLLLLLVNVQLTGVEGMPGGTGFRVVTVFLVAVVLVVVLRAAAGWSPGASWWTVVQAAARRTGDDVTGTFLLLVALGLCAVMVWMLAPLAVVVPGLLCLAVVAIEHRAAVRRG
ncbi:hypothetical protein [Cellulomonas fengjieae]|uniref:hypothetical protein n=1 Tax=Cellulomonas fengjieae TaxID=2819978 RepID=UPI001FBBF48B|nr:hypothetical protein [Cellulomonas fengjieae]